jgi:heme exporter protein D
VKPGPTTITPVPEVDYDGWTISSFCFTTMMVLIIILICIKYVRRFLQKRRQSQEREELLNLRQRVNNPFTGLHFRGILSINN